MNIRQSACIYRLLLMTLLMTTLLGGLSHAVAADLFVIAHPDIKLTADMIRDIYTGEKQFSGTVKIVPLDNAAAQEDFLKKVLRLDQSRYENLWVKKSFREALNPPAMRHSDKEIADMVRKTPGAIGYITSSPPGGVVVIQKF